MYERMYVNYFVCVCTYIRGYVHTYVLYVLRTYVHFFETGYYY